MIDNLDIQKYMQNGSLTKPFLDSDYVLEKVMIDYNSKIKNINGGHI